MRLEMLTVSPNDEDEDNIESVKDVGHARVGSNTNENILNSGEKVYYDANRTKRTTSEQGYNFHFEHSLTE